MQPSGALGIRHGRTNTWAKRSKSDSPTKNCTRPGCDRALRARGLCGSHYNQVHQPNRHAPTPTSCTICGKRIMRAYSSNRRPVCSVECRSLVSGYEYRGDYDWAQAAATRARQAGAVIVEVFDRAEIFSRDDWTCYLCGIKTDPTVGPFDATYPTVDHVIPLTRGGEHSKANANTACFACNSARLNFDLTST